MFGATVLLVKKSLSGVLTPAKGLYRHRKKDTSRSINYLGPTSTIKSWSRTIYSDLKLPSLFSVSTSKLGRCQKSVIALVINHDYYYCYYYSYDYSYCCCYYYKCYCFLLLFWKFIGQPLRCSEASTITSLSYNRQWFNKDEHWWMKLILLKVYLTSF